MFPTAQKALESKDVLYTCLTPLQCFARCLYTVGAQINMCGNKQNKYKYRVMDFSAL